MSYLPYTSMQMLDVIHSRSIYAVAVLAIVLATSTMSSPILNNHHVGTNIGLENNDNSCSTTNMILEDLREKYHHQPLFLQAVQEMILSIDDLLVDDAMYRQAFAIITEPERTISFRVTWMDDHGQVQINRGWRIEFNR